MPDVLNRDEFEQRMARITGQAFARQRLELLSLLGEPPSLDNVPVEWWLNGSASLARAIEPLLFEIFIQQAEAVQAASGIGVSWDLVNQSAVEWANRHAGELIQGIDRTTQRRVSDAVQRYFRDGQNIGQLQQNIGVWYSASRAENIAITEITNAASAGEQAQAALVAVENPNIEMVPFWETAKDERVCLICGPKQVLTDNGEPITDGVFPAAHPRCRCTVRYEARRRNG
jgi:hypothetical protein